MYMHVCGYKLHYIRDCTTFAREWLVMTTSTKPMSAHTHIRYKKLSLFLASLPRSVAFTISTAITMSAVFFYCRFINFLNAASVCWSPCLWLSVITAISIYLFSFPLCKQEQKHCAQFVRSVLLHALQHTCAYVCLCKMCLISICLLPRF